MLSRLKYKGFQTLSDRHKRRINAMKRKVSLLIEEKSSDVKDVLPLLQSSSLDGNMLKTSVFITHNIHESPASCLESCLDLNRVIHSEQVTFVTSMQCCPEAVENANIGNTIAPDDINQLKLKDDLARWAVLRGIKQSDLGEILRILKHHYPDSDLPIDPRTLLQTPRKVTVYEMAPGKYCHFGLKTAIHDFLNSAERDNIVMIRIQIGIDGLPISGSNNNQLWPIMCRVLDFSEVYLIGCYFGQSKPNDSNDFLQRFVEEMKILGTDGINYRGSQYLVHFDSLVCDAPAKSYVLKVKGHSGYSSCTKCTVEGDRKGKSGKERMCFPDLYCSERTDENYLQQVDDSHQLGRSILLDIPGFGFVTSVPLDYMHLVLVGVVKKLMDLWCTGPLSARILTTKNIETMSAYLKKIRSRIPKEFARKPRKIGEYGKWKATELRQFLLYTGVLVLKTAIDDDADLSQHFRTFHVAIRILCSDIRPSSISYAHNLLRHFVESFGVLYGEEYMSHNVHGLIHLARDAEKHGELDTFSAFAFENFLKGLKKRIRKPSSPLEQLIKRYGEKRRLKPYQYFTIVKENIFVKGKTYKWTRDQNIKTQYKRLFMNNILFTTAKNNNCCLMTNGEIICIQDIGKSYSEEIVIIGRSFLHHENLYVTPCESSMLNIFQVGVPSQTTKLWVATDIHVKMMVLPLPGNKDRFAVFPLLHDK